MKLKNNATPLTHYEKIVDFGIDKLKIEYSNKNGLPFGIYPRKILSFISECIVKSRSKDGLIKLPNSKALFCKKILGINYSPNKKDLEAINYQIKSFCNTFLSIEYSKETNSRKNISSMQYFVDDVDFLWDDSKKWQSSVKIAENMFQLIKTSTVPVSKTIPNIYRSAVMIDLMNYFLYQNYNLYIKNMDHEFDIRDLHYLFGINTADINDFKRYLKKNLSIFKKLNLDISIVKNTLTLKATNSAFLVTRAKKLKDAPPTIIKPQNLDKLIGQYGGIDVKAVALYVSKQQDRGKIIRHPYAYMREVLTNPHWYIKERNQILDTELNERRDAWIKRSDHEKNIVKSLLIRKIKNINLSMVPKDLQQYLEQLQRPGRLIVRIPDFSYVCTIFDSVLRRESIEHHDENIMKLIKLLKIMMTIKI